MVGTLDLFAPHSPLAPVLYGVYIGSLS